ncbi:MAG: hypothetical protein Q9174_006646, partial [Haloplaca sp. 1 TL-2023]
MGDFVRHSQSSRSLTPIEGAEMLFFRLGAAPFLAYALIPSLVSAAGSPQSLDSLQTLTQAKQNASLDVGSRGKWIPDDFKIVRIHRTSSIKRDDLFMTAIWFLSQQAKLDFNALLSRPQIAFRDPNTPRLWIVAAAPGPRQRIMRSHIFWAIASILNQMIKDDGFVGSIWRLQLKGQEVGTISIIAPGTDQLDVHPRLGNAATSRPVTIGPTPGPDNAGIAIKWDFLPQL